MNIRELDEESRRTGVWPPRRIILRVDRENDGEAPVKLDEVDLSSPAPRAAVAPPRAAPAPLEKTSLSPSVTPSRRPGLPGAGVVTPAPAASPEAAEFERWISQPLTGESAEPEYQAPPTWLPDDLRVRAKRRHQRGARKARAQLFGASAATTLAVGGCAAVLAVVGLSQTETVGGSLGVPKIGVFGTAPKAPVDDDGASTPAAKAPKRSTARTSGANRRSAARRERSTPSRAGSANARASSPPASTSASSGSRAPTQRAVNPPAPTQQRASNPPPPPPSPPPAPRQQSPSPQAPSSQAPAVVWDAPSQPAGSSAVPSRPAQTAPSRPATPVPSTSSSPAP